MDEETLKKYLLCNDIVVTNKKYYLDKKIYSNMDYYVQNKDKCLEKIKNQIILINAVHKVFMKYIDFESLGIKSTIGKETEKLKVDVKKLRNSLSTINIKNSMDEFLFSKGNVILTKSEENLSKLENIDTVSLIKRSMKKNEICLGIADETNLRIMERIEIGKLDCISYNLIETDICNYLRRIQMKNRLIDLSKLIDFYVDISNLNDISKTYIETCLKIPKNTIKVWKRYLKNRRNYESSYYLNRINSAYNSEIGI